MINTVLLLRCDTASLFNGCYNLQIFFMDYAERFSRLTIHFQTKETYFFPIFTFFLRIILEFTSKL